MGEGSWPEFSENDIRRIKVWLPQGGDPRRLKLLPKILREWAEVDLRPHFVPEAATGNRRERLARLGKLADRLLEALDGFDETDRITFASQIGIAEGQTNLEAIFHEDNKRRLDQSRDYIYMISAAGKQPLSKPRRGRPRNILTYLVMMDIAAVFEYLTDTAATRQVDRSTHEETGPFREFAGAIWSIVIGSDDGLSAALKNWAEGKKRHAECSPLIVNIAMRHPEWGLFPSF